MRQFILKLETKKDYSKAERLQSRLYEKFDNVQVITYGIDKIKIIAW